MNVLTILIAHPLDFKDKLATSTVDNGEVSLIPLCQGRQFWTGELGQGTEVKSVDS